MANRFADALRLPLSFPRLESYRPSGDSDFSMVTNYFHNIELSESLYPSLQMFEVALRNSIHSTLTSEFGGTNLWFDQPDLLLTWQKRRVAEARTALAQQGKPPTSDGIVAQLHFGFWQSLLSRPYEAQIWRAPGSDALHKAFPYAPRHFRSRQAIWERIDGIRNLRNRVFHYEPIWNWADLSKRHQHVLEAIAWISLEMHEAIGMCDRFPKVALEGRHALEERIISHVQRQYPG